MLVGGYSVLYLLSKGLSLEGLAILKGLQMAILLACSIPFSYLSDKYSRKNIIMLATVSSALWFGITAYSPNIIWVYIGEFFNAVSLALFNGPFEAFLIDAFKKHHPTQPISIVLGSFSKYTFLFMAIAVILGGLTPSTESSLFWWIGCISTISLFISGLFLFKIYDNSTKVSLDKAHTKYSFIIQLKSVITIIKKNKNTLLPFLFISICINFYYQIILQYWQPLSFELLGDFKKPYYYSIIFICILLVQSVSGKSVENAKKLKSIFLILILTISLVSFCLTLFQKDNNLIGLGFIFASFYILKLFQIITSSKINEYLPENQRATFISSISTLVRMLLFPVFFLLSSIISVFGLTVVPALGVLLIFTLPFIKKIQHTKCNRERQLKYEQ